MGLPKNWQPQLGFPSALREAVGNMGLKLMRHFEENSRQPGCWDSQLLPPPARSPKKADGGATPSLQPKHPLPFTYARSPRTQSQPMGRQGEKTERYVGSHTSLMRQQAKLKEFPEGLLSHAHSSSVLFTSEDSTVRFGWLNLSMTFS